MPPNVRVYKPLRCKSDYLSRYTKVTQIADLRKPTASNCFYTLLCCRAFKDSYYCYAPLKKLYLPSSINYLLSFSFDHWINRVSATPNDIPNTKINQNPT